MSFQFEPVTTVPGRGARNSEGDQIVKDFAAANIPGAKLSSADGKDLTVQKVRASLVSSVNKAAKKLALPVKAVSREDQVYLIRTEEAAPAK